MKKTMNKPLLAILIAGILTTSIYSQNSFAENSGCRGDCVAPTLGQLDDGARLVEKGLTINAQSFDVMQYSQVIPTQMFKVGQPIKVKMLVYENNGVESLRHVSLAISDYKDERNQNEKAAISFIQEFDGTQKTSILDFDKLFDNVKVSATTIDSFTTSIVITFSIQKPIETSSLIIDTWDDAKSSRKNIFLDAIKVEKKGTEKIEEKMPAKTTSEKTEQKPAKKVKEEKTSAKTKEKSKEKSSKTQVGKGKKNQRTNVK